MIFRLTAIIIVSFAITRTVKIAHLKRVGHDPIAVLASAILPSNILIALNLTDGSPTTDLADWATPDR